MSPRRTNGVYPEYDGDSSRKTQQTFLIPLKELQAIKPRLDTHNMLARFNFLYASLETGPIM